VAGALFGGAVLLAAATLLDPGTSYLWLGGALFLLGIVMGGVFIPSTDAVMASVPEANAGIGSGLNDASRQVGAAIGIGVLGSVTNAFYASGVGDALARLDPATRRAATRSVAQALQVADGIGGSTGDVVRRAAVDAFTDGFGLAMVAAAVVLAVGAILGWRRLPADDRPAESVNRAAAHGTPHGDGRRKGGIRHTVPSRTP
jgi:hypothetical protein